MGPSGVHCKVTKYLRLWQTISWRLTEYPYLVNRMFQVNTKRMNLSHLTQKYLLRSPKYYPINIQDIAKEEEHTMMEKQLFLSRHIS